jgi:hypothetical protein
VPNSPGIVRVIVLGDESVFFSEDVLAEVILLNGSVG